MIQLEGIKIKRLDFDLQKLGDLYSFEGPFLSHFCDDRGYDYLMNWVDVNDILNRWILFKTNKESLNKYFSKKISLLGLIQENEQGLVYFLDIDDKAEYENIWAVSVNNIPLDYSPTNESYFDVNHANEYAIRHAKENKKFILDSKESFMNKVVKQLFRNKKKERDWFLSHNTNSIWGYEPDTLDEITTIKAMYFPLLLHYHQDADNILLRNLIKNRSLAYVKPSDYITSIVSVVTGKDFAHEKFNVNDGLGEVIESTIHIVNQHPNIEPLFNDWVKMIGAEYDNIDVFHKHIMSLSKQKHQHKESELIVKKKSLKR